MEVRRGYESALRQLYATDALKSAKHMQRFSLPWPVLVALHDAVLGSNLKKNLFSFISGISKIVLGGSN
jgi:hypothetical protein